MIWLQTQEEQESCAKSCYETMASVQPEKWRVLHTDTTSGILMNRTLPDAKFAVIVSGGAGNGPLFSGYVAPELADAVVSGGAYAAPNAYALYEAGKYLGSDRDILLLYNHFAGDYLNNDMAKELLQLEGIHTLSVEAADDIATAVGEPREERNGRCGIALLIRLAGACRNRGMSLEDTVQLLQAANSRLTTISLHMQPQSGEAVFGAGFSKEPGIAGDDGKSKQAYVQQAIDLLLQDLPVKDGEVLVLLVNRLRLMSYPDGYITAGIAHRYLSEKYTVSHIAVGAFSNILDIYGCDFSILRASPQVADMFRTKADGDGFAV